MSSSSILPVDADLGGTFGALFISVMLAAVLFGLSNVQALVYFQTHKGTGITFYKLAVVGLWILDAMHLAFIIHCVYYYLVNNYGNIDTLTEVVWSFKLQIVINVLIINGVHLLYVHRIWIVSKGRIGRSKVFPIAVAVAIVTLDSGVSIAMIWAVYQCHVTTDAMVFEWALYMSLAESTSIDILIASSLCYLLATSRTGFSSTDSFITKLMGYIVNTGILTSICSLASIVTCAVMPKNFVFLGVEFLLAKLYVNSCVALLNARHYLRPDRDVTDSREPHVRYNIQTPELPTCVSRDDKLQASRQSLLGREVVHSTQPIQAAMTPLVIID